jgi:hypothetical protein
MTIYQVLRQIVQRLPAMPETERADVLATIDEAEQWSVFGTVAGQLSVKAHDCIPTYPNGPAYPPICGLCHQLMDKDEE